MIIYAVFTALVMDYFLGEPRRFHPLVGLGLFAEEIEALLNHSHSSKLSGIIAVGLIVLPLWCFAYLLERASGDTPVVSFCLSATVLYLAIGWKSLLEHAKAIRIPLQAEDLEQARQKVAYIVSRDTDSLSAEGVAKAATESVLENGSDAVFAPIFWFIIGGIPGVLVYRVVNTLDAMWGYKNTRFFYFGWAAARLDDALNWMPARLCALTYALCGNTQIAFDCWRKQAGRWKSPNAGPVMASGAGALKLKLGGDAVYKGYSDVRPQLGCGDKADYKSIQKAESLLNRSLILWVVVLAVGVIVL